MIRNAWIDHPPVNVITRALCAELIAQIRDDGHALVLRGHGKCFSAGVDIKEHLPGEIERTLPAFHELVLALWNCTCPTVSVVHGYALGGGLELCLATDFTLASQDAQFGFPEITLGVFPPVAAAALERTIGSKRAAELLFTGKKISASTALEWGLVNATFAPADLDRGVHEFLRTLESHSICALRACKKAIPRHAFPLALRAAERIYLTDANVPEAHTKMSAFLKRRK